MSNALSWEAIAQQYLPDIRAYVKYLGCHGACEDDVVQDILIRLNTLLQQGRLTGDLMSMHGIIREVCRTFVKNALRKSSRLAQVGATTHDGELNPAVEDEEQDLDQTRSNVEVMRELVDKLPEQQKEVVSMRVKGLTLLEVSAVLGISKNAVAKRERTAIRSMRNKALATA